MAKRKRLTPARSDMIDTVPSQLETKSMPFNAPPIAQVAGDAAAAAALDELAGEVKRARTEGRMIQSLPLSAVDAGYLQRDRITANTEELDELVASIRDRGQQTPIEVVALPDGGYGLISGWRRLTALRKLYDATGETQFAQVNAIERHPESAADAYVAMVEENEIRLGLSYYERARIVAKAVEQGAYDSEKQALQSLFSTASRAKRSKIKSFLVIYHALDAYLQFPSAIPERLGISLARQIEDDTDRQIITRLFLAEIGTQSSSEELAALQRALAEFETGLTSPIVRSQTPEPKTELADQPSTQPDAKPVATEKVHVSDQFTLLIRGETLSLSGPGVTEELRKRLISWLKTQTQ